LLCKHDKDCYPIIRSTFHVCNLYIYYLKIDDTAVWSNSLEVLAEQLGVVIKEWLVDNVPTVVYENMKKISSEFTVENHEKTLISAFSNIIENRKTLIKQAIENEK
jgi:hypothetical protein